MAAGQTLDCYRMETQWVDKPLDPELTETPGGKKELLQKIFQHELTITMNTESFSMRPVFASSICINLHVHALVCLCTLRSA